MGSVCESNKKSNLNRDLSDNVKYLKNFFFI